MPTNSDEEIESEEEALLSEQVLRMQRDLEDQDQTKIEKEDEDLVMGHYYKRLMTRSQ